MSRYRKPNRELGQYVFTGLATVSVYCEVEADSLEEAKEMVDSGDCEWVCDYVDGDVIDIEEAN